MRSIRQELISVAAVISVPAALIAIFPYGAIGFKAVPRPKASKPSAAFVRLTAAEEAEALKAAKARCAAAARKAGRGATLRHGKGGHHAKAAAGHRGKASLGKKGGAKKRRR